MGLKPLFLVAAIGCCQSASATDLRVFAAASLTDALDEALVVCAAETEIEATGVYAGSGTIARQINQGAPADIYISANPQWMDWLEKRERIVEETRLDLVGNELVTIVSADAREKMVAILSHPPAPLANLGNYRIAVADTQNVPAGIYARQAMERAKTWEKLRGRLVQASNVREALTWVARGEAEFGIVYRTDALNEPRVGVQGVFQPEDHDPIRYPAAVIADNDSPEARRLLACLTDEKALDVFKRFGFTLLSE